MFYLICLGIGDSKRLLSSTIPKWVNELPSGRAQFLKLSESPNINITVKPFSAQILPAPLPKTRVVGYTGTVLYYNYT
jgi:hypothetical protein